MNKIALIKLKACLVLMSTDSSLNAYRDFIKQRILAVTPPSDVKTQTLWYGHHPSDVTAIMPPDFGDCQFKYLRVFSDVLPGVIFPKGSSKVCYFDKVNASTSRVGFNFEMACNLLGIKPERKLLDFLLHHKQAFLYFGFITWVKDNGLSFYRPNVNELQDKVKHALVKPALKAGVSDSFATRIFETLDNK